MKPIIPGTMRYKILQTLSACRGYRAYPVSLLHCLDAINGKRGQVLVVALEIRRLHNVCASLFKAGLIEVIRGMYQLTPVGLAMIEGV